MIHLTLCKVVSKAKAHLLVACMTASVLLKEFRMQSSLFLFFDDLQGQIENDPLHNMETRK